MNERKNYIDNIRWITVCLVVIYHLIYNFNCSGAIKNIEVDGIPILDSYLVFVYPWFMCLLFVVSGISSCFALQKRTDKEFIRDRAARILLPSICGIFIYGWITGYITNQYTDMFAGNGNGDAVPAPVKYLIYCMTGIGPLWFAHVVFVASLVLIIVRKLDRNNKLYEPDGKTNYAALAVLTIVVLLISLILNAPIIVVCRFGIYIFMFLWFARVVLVASLVLIIVRKLNRNNNLYELGGKTNYAALAVLTIVVWLSSLILNTPVIVVYRFGIYIFMFLLGYFIFSHDEVIEKLKKISVPMGIIAFAVGILYTIRYYGTNYADMPVLKSLFTNIYLWIAILAILGLSAKFLDFRNKFTAYMTKNNFAFYVLHLPIEVVLGYLLVENVELPFGLYYVLILIGTAILLPILSEIIRRIPVLRKLVLGISKPKKNSLTPFLSKQ